MPASSPRPSAAAGGTLGGYDALTGVTYVWLGQALIGPVYFFAWNELAQRIRTGDIAVDLARPVDPMLAHLAADLGRAAFVFLPRGLPPLAVGAVVTGLALPGDPRAYVLGLLSVALAVVVSFACRWLVNLPAFWLLDLRGPMTLYLLVTNILCGLAVPVRWFPEWLAATAAVDAVPVDAADTDRRAHGPRRRLGRGAAARACRPPGPPACSSRAGSSSRSAPRKLVIQGG